jgi:hypothetical protein
MIRIVQFVSPRAFSPAVPKAVAGFSVFLVHLMFCGGVLFGQALPAAEAAPISTGFALPSVAGSLQYAVSASETLSWGYYGNQGAAAATNVSGDLGFISNSRSDPFSIVFTGGHSWSETSYQPSYSFAGLALSQVITAGRWNYVISDSVSYLPGTPTTGLSGVAGVGDLGLNPVQVGLDTGQGVLTNYSTRVTNTAAASVQRALTSKTSLNASGDYAIMDFLGGTGDNGLGLNNDSKTGAGGISHQFDGRNTLGGNYVYSSYDFGSVAPGFSSQTASASYSHQFTRKLGMAVSAGPQWTTVDVAGNTTGLSLFASASASFAEQFSHATITYARGTNDGFGVLGGALSDSVSFTAGRVFNRVWNCTFTTSYARNTSLPAQDIAPYSLDTVVAGAQVSRALVRTLSAYASYTFERQSNSSGVGLDVFNGLSQVVGFGLTYSPRPVHFGRQ